MSYAATFDVQPPKEFDKAQVVLRILIILVISAILQIGNIIFGGMYLILPVVAAVLISQKGAERFLAEAEDGPTKWLRYLMAFYSYMALATDTLPTKQPEEIVQLNVQAGGSPTVGSALLRLILGIPHAIALAILGIVFAVVWVIAAISILLSGGYPQWASSYIRGYLRWTARFFAYLASLVDEYPPFSLGNGEEPAPSGGAPQVEAASEPPATEPSGGDTSPPPETR